MGDTYTVPNSHLALLQAIFRELVLARDSAAEFINPVVDPEPKKPEATIGA